MKHPLRFVLFDLDGTLVDTSPLHDRGYREALATHRPELVEGFRYDRITGLTTEEAFARLGISDPAERALLVRAKRAVFSEAIDRFGVRAFAGAQRLLCELARRGVPSYVVTSASRRGAAMLVRKTGLAMYLRGMIAADDVVHGKPSPEPFLLALRRFGLRAREGIVIEDAESGLTAARAAGLVAIRVNGPTAPTLAALGDGVLLADFGRRVSTAFRAPHGLLLSKLPNTGAVGEPRARRWPVR
jgi:HAD superfamily hydrolase (TIGR01509 family)